MKSRPTCHRAVSPKITPYRGLLICCLLRYLVALHSALSLNSGIVTLTSIPWAGVGYEVVNIIANEARGAGLAITNLISNKHEWNN